MQSHKQKTLIDVLSNVNHFNTNRLLDQLLLPGNDLTEIRALIQYRAYESLHKCTDKCSVYNGNMWIWHQMAHQLSSHGASPDTILQLMVIGWKDFPGDSAGLVACPWGMILQLAVIGWNAELLWEPWVSFSAPLACDPVLSEHDDCTVSLFTPGIEERENNECRNAAFNWFFLYSS